VDDDTTGKARPKRTAPVSPAVAPPPDPEDAPPAEPQATADPVPAWLRFAGQQPTVFPSLGGVVAPGDVVRPCDDTVTTKLLARGDFVPTEEPAPDATGDSTAN
jgi:hypothetical protein